jgi:glycosyltransferase involved in cell wall biosynthesis
MVGFVWTSLRHRPHAALIFSASGLSFVEKSFMALVARSTGAKVILAVRSGYFVQRVEGSARYKTFAKLGLWPANRILCQGQAWVDFYRKQMSVRPDKLFMVQNWIDAEPYLKLERKLQRDEPFRMLFVGWIERKKGVFDLLEAVARHSKLQDVEVDFLGGGRSVGELKERAAALGVGERFHLHGWKADIEKLDYFQRADVLVLPTHAEGFPNVILEAMAAGLPVVTTPVGGIPDVVHHGVNGLLVPVNDVSALGDALADLVDSREVGVEMGRRNRELVEARHDLKGASEKLEVILREISPAFAASLPSDPAGRR